jgi:hypothetical protein
MERIRTAVVSVFLASVAIFHATASAVGDATWTLASSRAMALPQPASPMDRLWAVYRVSEERAEMLRRLAIIYPTLRY